MKYIIIFITCFLSSVIINAQLKYEWSTEYNGSANKFDLGYDIIIDSTGNTYVTGTASNTGTGSDAIIIKYSSAGVKLWSDFVSVSSTYFFESGLDIKLDNSGGVYIAGVADTDGRKPFIVKYNSAGVQQWIRFPADSASIYSTDFTKVRVEGNHVYFLISGMKNNEWDCYLFKYDLNGNLIWTISYGVANNKDDIFADLRIDSNGNIYIAGTIENLSFDFALWKYSSSGQQVWMKTFNSGSNYSDQVCDIELDKLDNIYIIGNNVVLYPQMSDLYLLKYDINGVLKWTYQLNHTQNCWWRQPSDMVIDDFNNIYFGTKTGCSGMELFKLNQVGSLIWEKSIPKPGYTGYISGSLSIDRYNRVNLYGIYRMNDSLTYKALQQYNSNGDLIENKLYPLVKNDRGFNDNQSHDIDNDGNIYATGGNGKPDSLNNTLSFKFTAKTNSVSGLVTYKDNNQPVSGGFVKALFYDRSSARIKVMDSTVISPNGYYTLPKLPIDSVYLMFYQDDEEFDFVPTYYPSTISWSDAQKVYISNKLTNINCQVYRINNSNNPFTISGRVTYFGTGSAPIEDAIIYAKSGNEFRNFAMSGITGNYILNMLASGSYTLIAHRIGFLPQTKNIFISNSNLINIDFEFGNPIIIKTIYAETPVKFTLYQNYPNPFNPKTTLRFALAEGRGQKSEVRLVVYNSLGQKVITLVDGEMNAGTYEVEFDGSDLSSGVYYYSLMIGQQVIDTKRLVLIK